MAGRGHKDIFARDIEWTRAGDGVRYAGFPLDPDDAGAGPLMVLAQFAPGEVVDPHTHDCNYIEYITQGSQMVGKIDFAAGDVRWASAGTGYGPIKVGPEGCTVLIVFQNGAKSPPMMLGKAKQTAKLVRSGEMR
ncbi:hypothetical protein M9978_20470 [Sphingomonas sp. MG17]|uniref:Cupin domain-containing protein n=1 Tax=Sphingomonas tagetis TaxID=2949092 RepID=A0A9X2HSQ4_9SPHN|nr:hypothetical protein [Sphingomonas tagetis]MCP3732798.1 hypothetical protein [Sphingomonas tagetis]